MCHEKWEKLFIYNRNNSTSWEISWLREQSLKLNHHTTSPFLRIWYTTTYSNKWLGMLMAVHYNDKVHGQSGLRVLRFPGSGIWVPCRHGWIFMAAQVWHGMLQVLALGHSFEQLVWQEWLEPGSSGLPVLQVKQVWAAFTVKVGAVEVVLLRSSVYLEPAVWQWFH